jgi:hypothetical protein
LSAALALRDEAEVSGVRLRLSADGKVKVGGGAPPELLARLREHKAELAELLAGHLCKHCGGVMNWPAPVGVMFADGTGAHHACHEQAEVERIKARAANAVSPAALADEAEVTIRCEELS